MSLELQDAKKITIADGGAAFIIKNVESKFTITDFTELIIFRSRNTSGTGLKLWYGNYDKLSASDWNMNVSNNRFLPIQLIIMSSEARKKYLGTKYSGDPLDTQVFLKITEDGTIDQLRCFIPQ